MFLKFPVSLIFLAVLLSVAAAQKETAGSYAGIVNGAATFLPVPEYPPEAKDFCAKGKVEIAVLIGEDGKVLEAEAISGDELLYDVSVKAAKKATFSRMINGKPVKKSGIVVYDFDSLAPKCISVGIVNKSALKIPKPSVNLTRPRTEVIIGVQIMVDVSGKVTAARAVSGNRLIRSVFEKAARQAEFSPTFINGPTIKVKGLLVYKLKPDGTIVTDIKRDDKTVIGTPVNLIELLPLSCTCKGLVGSVLVEARTDEQGNVIEAKALSGHPILRNTCEKAALQSKFLPTYTKAKIFLVYNFEATDKSARAVRLKDIEIKEVRIEK